MRKTRGVLSTIGTYSSFSREDNYCLIMRERLKGQTQLLFVSYVPQRATKTRLKVKESEEARTFLV